MNKKINEIINFDRLTISYNYKVRGEKKFQEKPLTILIYIYSYNHKIIFQQQNNNNNNLFYLSFFP